MRGYLKGQLGELLVHSVLYMTVSQKSMIFLRVLANSTREMEYHQMVSHQTHVASATDSCFRCVG